MNYVTDADTPPPPSCVALRGFSLRGFRDIRGLPFCGGKKGLDSLLRWGKPRTSQNTLSENPLSATHQPLGPSLLSGLSCRLAIPGINSGKLTNTDTDFHAPCRKRSPAKGVWQKT